MTNTSEHSTDVTTTVDGYLWATDGRLQRITGFFGELPALRGA